MRTCDNSACAPRKDREDCLVFDECEDYIPESEQAATAPVESPSSGSICPVCCGDVPEDSEFVCCSVACTFKYVRGEWND
jgi:hypothetical protein